jgi:hypothetical protein
LLFQEAGFEVDTKEVHWVSKVVVATKPDAAAVDAAVDSDE